jgi:hypothetical protein
MVSITGWHTFDERGDSVCSDGTLDYIKPHIWVGDLRNDLMKNFDVRKTLYPAGLQPADSPSADFVIAALGHSGDYVIYQSPERDWCPSRIYVRLVWQPESSV